MPDAFLKSRGVDRLYGGSYIALQPYNFQKRSSYAYPINRAGDVADSKYRIQGDRCYIIPEQNAAATYRLWYVPKYSALVSGALPSYMDTNSWHEYAVADVGAKVQQKQDLDASVFVQQKLMLRDRIVNAAKTRDAGPPKRMVDTRYGRSDDRGGWGRW